MHKIKQITRGLAATLMLLTVNAGIGQEPSEIDFLIHTLPVIAGAITHRNADTGEVADPPESSVAISMDVSEGDLPSEMLFEARISPSERTISSYAWDFGDGHSAHEKITRHIYSALGEYMVRVVVTAQNGDVSRASRVISVKAENVLPVANFSSTPATGYAPLDVQFDASSSFDDDGRIASYFWAFGDGTTHGTTQALATHRYDSIGVYTRYAASLTVTDDRGGAQKTTQYIVVNQADLRPVARFDMTPDAGGAPFFIKFDASLSSDIDGYIVDYKWDFDDGKVADGKLARHTYMTAGTYYPSLEVTDDSGNKTSSSQSLTVSPQNQLPNAVFSASPASASAPASVHFNANSSSDEDGSITAYNWDFGDGKTGQGVAVSHVYPRPGRYQPLLLVSDNEAGVGVATKMLTVTGQPALEPEIVIRTPGGSTTENPFPLDGVAPTGSDVDIYVNDIYQQTVQPDEYGIWKAQAALLDGKNRIRAQVPGADPDNGFTISVAYSNLLSRGLSGMEIDKPVVLTPGVPPRPYFLDSGQLTIAESGELIVQAGTEIQFNGGWGTGIRVAGDLLLMGSADKPVRLTSDALNEDGTYLQWLGIRVLDSAETVLIEHASIDKAADSLTLTGTPVSIKNSVFKDSGVTLINPGAVSIIEASEFIGGFAGLEIYGDADVNVTGNTFTQNSIGIDLRCSISESGGATHCPQLDIHRNNLLSNAPIRLEKSLFGLQWHNLVDARENWWGTVDIRELAVEGVDSRGFVDGPLPGGKRYAGAFYDEQGLVISLTDETILSAGKRYFVYSDIYLPADASLRLEQGSVLRLDNQFGTLFDLFIEGELVIEEGAKVEALGFNGVKIYGDMQVNGMPENPVVFTSGQESPARKDWSGIYIAPDAVNVRVEHAHIEYATQGIRFTESSGVLSHSVLSENRVGVLLEGDARPLITGNTISNNQQGIVERGSDLTPEGPDAQIKHNNLHNNQSAAVSLEWSSAENKVRRMPENWWGSTDVDQISGEIFDHLDDERYPYLNFSGYLDGPLPGGAPYLSGAHALYVINHDLTLKASEYYFLLGDIYVPEGVTLTLDPGVILQMQGESGVGFDLIVDGALVLNAGSAIEFGGNDQVVEINGSLVISGTLDDSVLLSSSRLKPGRGDWQGIHVTPSASSVIIDHAQIRHAERGIWFDGVSGVVSNALFEANTVAILGSGFANPQLSGNQFYDNSFDVQILGNEIVSDNQRPVARFIASSRPDDSAFTVNFDARSSSDDSQVRAYSWRIPGAGRTTGSLVTHTFDVAQSYSVQLTVMDEHAAIDTVSQIIDLTAINIAPIANAGKAQFAEAGTEVMLDGRNSVDEDGTIEVYRWLQLQGPAVTLSDSASAIPVFIMPALGLDESLQFQLTVTDNAGASTSDSVLVSPIDHNIAPTAYAGRDHSVAAGAEAILDGAYSYDEDGSIAAYSWIQTAGPAVALSATDLAIVSFIMPDLETGQFLSFELTVSDDQGATTTDSVTIGRVNEVILRSNLSSGTPPLKVHFDVETNSMNPIQVYSMDYDFDGVLDTTQDQPDGFSFTYDHPGVYSPYVAILDDQGNSYFDQINITVVSIEEEQAALKLEWDAMRVAMLSGNIEMAMSYFDANSQEKYTQIFESMGSEKINAIFANIADIELQSVSGQIAEVTVFRMESGQLYAFPISFIRDENGVWKLLKL